ncbi:somatomedin-B and thrombospondin type-1 domain-containing protein-like isoform X2 [Venturia canescens]|uniref:somatomedin-B and thrombospondin type-1 domain-containing protein-like isoform X2 n=1 Tax=Venturia canescens TaxID=32260 RepID=UPI001C9BF62C|nr:somatomedin-B and thrombospondin type-1 domain-containing protein-like isoform X2 [Venturia canescens]
MGPAIVQLFAIGILSMVKISAGGSCSAAKLCCEGRDSGCVIQKASPNAIIETPQDKPCYCDHACLKLNDCCHDFRDACRVVDCVVGEWEEWSPCEDRCAAGVQTRTRSIVEPSTNGGKHCPQLEQSRTCHSFTGCSRNSRTALLTMASMENFAANEVNNDGYCATFTIVRVSRACIKEFPTLTEGMEICVMCRADIGATRCPDHGRRSELGGIGRWKMMTSTSVRCHGKWIGGTNVASQCDSAISCRDVTRRLVFV